MRVILDRRLRTPPDARLFEDVMVPVWLICAADEEQASADALQELGAEIVPVPSILDGHPAMRTRSIRSRCAASRACWWRAVLRSRAPLLDADLVDEAVIYQGSEGRGQRGICLSWAKGLIG